VPQTGGQQVRAPCTRRADDDNEIGDDEMIEPRALDDLARRIGALLPPGLDRVPADLRENLKALVSASLDRMDVVTREEFDVQAAVLARTREKLEALERRVSALEAARGE